MEIRTKTGTLCCVICGALGKAFLFHHTENGFGLFVGMCEDTWPEESACYRAYQDFGRPYYVRREF